MDIKKQKLAKLKTLEVRCCVRKERKVHKMFEKWAGVKLKFSGLSLWLVLIAGLYHKIYPASALFEGCDNEYRLNSGESYVLSPNYPGGYPSRTSCRYKLIAPLDYGISVKCNLSMPKNPTTCSTERFYLSREGNLDMADAEEFCGFGEFERSSLFDTVTLAYVSTATSGRFSCVLDAQPRQCECGWSQHMRIRNGQEALPNEFPSAAALKDRSSNLQSFCGATIIAHYYLLTAAHCTKPYRDVSYIVALVGDLDLSKQTESYYAAQYDIAQKFEHPGYTLNARTNDIGLLRTARPIQWSRGVGPICLPPPSEANNKFEYMAVDVIGWGNLFNGGIRSPTLQKAELLITDNAACARYYANISRILPTQVCTYDSFGGSRDTCEYDSGGPVIIRKAHQFQIGVISFGTPCGVGEYSIGVNTRITPYLQWIDQITKYTTCQVNFS